jgi:hypothetical protein
MTHPNIQYSPQATSASHSLKNCINQARPVTAPLDLQRNDGSICRRASGGEGVSACT